MSGGRALTWPAAVCGALLVLLATGRHGPGVSPDSTLYLSAARSLADGHGLTQFDGQPLVRWAPLYPAMLAGIASLGADVATAARGLGAISFGVFVLLAGAWLRRHVRPPALRAVGLAAVTLSPALLADHVHAWSEPPFLVCALLCLLDLERYARRGTAHHLLRAAVWAAGATLARYAGASLVIPGLWVALGARDKPIGRRARAAAAFAAISLGPFALWLMRNQLVGGSALGERAASSYTLAQSAYVTLEGMSLWLVPAAGPGPLRALLAAAALAAGAWVLAGARRAEARPGADGSAESGSWPLAPAGVWTAAYAALLVVWTSSTAVEHINERYLSPLYLPLVGLGLRAVATLAARGARESAGRLALAACLVWLAYPTARTTLRLRSYLREGAGGYATTVWQESQLARALRGRPAARPLYSNAPDAANFLAGAPARLAPRKYFYNSRQRAQGDLDEFRAALRSAPSGRAYLAWFSMIERPFLYSVAELEGRFVIRADTTCADGTLYLVTDR